MAVTVTGPLGTPINLASNVIVGGSLDASTTYYWRVMAQDSDSVFFCASAQRRGDLSAEGTFTTNATNKQAELSWDAVTGATHYVVILSKVSGDYVGNNRCGSNANNSTTSTNSYTVTGNSTLGPHMHYLLPDSIYWGPLGYLREKTGRVLVSFDGTTSLQDIYNQIVADGLGDYAYYDGFFFWLNGSIAITGTASGTLTVLETTLVLHGTIRNPVNSNRVITFGQSIHSSYRLPCNIYMLWLATDVTFGSNTVFNGGSVEASINYVSAAIRTFNDLRPTNGGVSFNRTRVGSGIRFASNNTHPMYSVEFGDVLFLGATNSSQNWDIVFSRAPGYPFYIQSLGGGNYYRIIFDYAPNISAHFYLADNNTEEGVVNLYDCEFKYSEGNLPKIYWRQLGRTYWTSVDMYFTFLVKIIGKGGTPISGANVLVKNVNGATVSSLESNADGYVFDDSITATSASTTTITDTSKSWATNEHRGKQFLFASGRNAGVWQTVLSNTDTTLAFELALSVSPAIGDGGGFPVFLRGCTKSRDTSYSGDSSSPIGEILTYHTPHTITITKSGYQTKTMVLTMDRKREEVVVLEKQVETIVAKGKVAINTEPENSQSDVFV
jgi:hypothetical protein